MSKPEPAQPSIDTAEGRAALFANYIENQSRTCAFPVYDAQAIADVMAWIVDGVPRARSDAAHAARREMFRLYAGAGGNFDYLTPSFIFAKVEPEKPADDAPVTAPEPKAKADAPSTDAEAGPDSAGCPPSSDRG
jgi:hypothetical protein